MKPKAQTVVCFSKICYQLSHKIMQPGKNHINITVMIWSFKLNDGEVVNFPECPLAGNGHFPFICSTARRWLSYPWSVWCQTFCHKWIYEQLLTTTRHSSSLQGQYNYFMCQTHLPYSLVSRWGIESLGGAKSLHSELRFNQMVFHTYIYIFYNGHTHQCVIKFWNLPVLLKSKPLIKLCQVTSHLALNFK